MACLVAWSVAAEERTGRDGTERIAEGEESTTQRADFDLFRFSFAQLASLAWFYYRFAPAWNRLLAIRLVSTLGWCAAVSPTSNRFRHIFLPRTSRHRRRLPPRTALYN